jgi:predicted DNA binding protein
MYEVVFKVAYDSFYCDVSRKYPSFKMFAWCTHTYDVNEVLVEEPEEYKLVMNEIKAREPNALVEESSDQQRLSVTVQRCTCNAGNSVSVNVRDLHILLVPPSVIEKGWEHHRAIIYRHEDFETLIQRLEENGFFVEVLRKVPFEGFISSSLTLTTDTLLSGLTERQASALLTAHKYGYYKLPRRTDVQTISMKEHVSRTTFQEHLKKAENKIIEAMVPYITMFKLNTREQRQRLKLM